MDLQLGLFPDMPAPVRGRGVGAAAADEALSALARRMPEGLRLGTSSWSFPGWRGIVYDREASSSTLARTGLRAYGRHPLLRAVGLDRTYYRPIDAQAYRRYAEDVPSDFRFLVKADRRITSPTDPERRDGRFPNPDFLDPARARDEVVGPALEGLGSKLGPLLFQFSPVPARDLGGAERFADRLASFLAELPRGPLYAVELRTPDLLTRRYGQALEAAGAAHGYTVHPSMPPLERQAALLPPHYQPALVLRWMLRDGLSYEAAKGRYQPFGRLVDEDPGTRHRIALMALDALIAERTAFVVANNKAEGSAPLTLLRLAEHLARWKDVPAEGASGGGIAPDSPDRPADASPARGQAGA